jgi:hypothetical protein
MISVEYEIHRPLPVVVPPTITFKLTMTVEEAQAFELLTNDVYTNRPKEMRRDVKSVTALQDRLFPFINRVVGEAQG